MLGELVSRDYSLTVMGGKRHSASKNTSGLTKRDTFGSSRAENYFSLFKKKFKELKSRDEKHVSLFV
jgi:hypothetical protein